MFVHKECSEFEKYSKSDLNSFKMKKFIKQKNFTFYYGILVELIKRKNI